MPRQQVYLMADSSVIKTNKPFFIPHFASSFLASSAIVLHIDRLGKHIASRFAHRYCHSIAPAVKLTATGTEGALGQSFDGALLLGDSIPVDSNLDINQASVEAQVGEHMLPSLSLSEMAIDYRTVISELSVYFTLKMGDMIVVELADCSNPLQQGWTINALLNGRQQLTVRVK